MKRIAKILIALIMLVSLSACVQKIDNRKPIYMYPAFKVEKNKKLWGYIDSKGKFVVEPKYDMTHDFTFGGLAKVEKDGLSGVINSNGEEILAPKYQTISEFKDGYFVGFDGRQNQLFNYRGDVQFFGENQYIYIGSYSDGLFAVATMNEGNQIEMGYISKSGNLVIDPEYSRAYDFIDGKAIVQENKGDKYKIIDKDNNLVKELEYEDVRATSNNGIYLFRGKSELYGLLDSNGDIIIEDKFHNIGNIDGEHILVNTTEDDEKRYGVVDKKGEYVIQPEYMDIILLGDGYFGLSKEGDQDEDSLYAIANSKGELITEAKYYGAGGVEGKIKNGLISVTDGENTYALDLRGNKSDKVPVMFGSGEISFDGKVARANVAGMLSYYNAKGELIWEEINTYILREGVAVTEKRYLEGKSININYPIVGGLKNKEAQDKINERLYREFTVSYDLGGKLSSNDYKYYRTKYNVNRINDVMVVEQVIEVLGKEDLEPIMSGNIYNINLSNGNFYELKDLFEDDSGYIETLTDIIRGLAEEKNSQGTGMYDLANWEGVKPGQDFIAQVNTIDIYFKPDQMLSYSEQFPRFTIEQEYMDDILDLNSEFWWAYSISKGF